MAGQKLDIVDSDTVLFLLVPGYEPYYVTKVTIDLISYDCCGIHIALHGPLYDVAEMMAKIKGELTFTLSIQNNLCGPSDYFDGEQTIISIEDCKVVVEYLEKVVKLRPYEDIDILMMHVDIIAREIIIYDSGEEILTWLDRS